MEKKWRDILITAAVFFIVITIGGIYIVQNTILGYTDSAILLLAAVIAAGCFWIGTNMNQKP